MGNGKPQEIAAIAWSCAKLGFQAPSLFRAIDDSASFLVAFGDPQAVANLAWSCGSLNLPAPSLLRAIDGSARRLVKEGSSRDVANTVWAFAKLGAPAPSLFLAVERSAAELVNGGDTQNVANMAWACAKLGVPSPLLFRAIEARASLFAKNGTPQELANVAWAASTLRVRSPSLFRAVEERAEWMREEGSPQNIRDAEWATAVHSGRSPSPAPQRTSAVSRSKVARNEATSRHEAKSKKSKHIEMNKRIASLGRDWRRLLELYEEKGAEFNNVNWATLLSQLGNMGGRERGEVKRNAKVPVPQVREKAFFPSCLQFQGFLSSLSSIVQKDIRFFSVREVSNIANALAKLGQPDKAIFRSIEENAAWIVENGEPQAVASTAWACAVLKIQSPSLFRSIEDNAARIVKNEDMQATAIVAWSCAKLGVQAPSLFRAIDDRAAWLVENGTPQNVANIAWACATLGIPAPSFFRFIDENAAKLVANGKPQEISNTVWAFAKLGVHICDAPSRDAPSLFRSVEERSDWLVSNGKTQEVANTAWSFGKLGIHSPSLFQSIDGRSSWLVENGTPQDIANTVLAFAEVGIRPEQLFSCLPEGGCLERFLRGANSQEFCNLAWSIASLGLSNERDASILTALWTAALRDHSEKLTTDELRQLAQVRAHAGASGVALSPALPSALEARLVKACKSQSGTGSAFGAEYSRLLSEIGFEHEREVSPFANNSSSGDGAGDGGDFGEFLAIDMACRKLKIAVECDGKSHFLTSLTPGARANFGRENGRTAAKRRLLRQLGWKVVSVPFQVDRAMEEDEERIEREGGKRELKKAYLEGELAKIGVAM